MSSAPGACRDPQGRSLSREGALGTRTWPSLLPSQWYCLRPESEVCVCPVLLPGGGICCQPCEGRAETGFSPRSVPAAHILSRREAPYRPRAGGLPALRCPAGWSPRVPQPLHRKSALPLGRPSCSGLLQLTDWACGQPEISALGGGSTAVKPPPDF